jgi:hypothetical protein
MTQNERHQKRAWLEGYLEALESRKRMGMTEAKRRDYLDGLEDTLPIADQLGPDMARRVREQIALLRGWECMD